MSAPGRSALRLGLLALIAAGATPATAQDETAPSASLPAKDGVVVVVAANF